MKNRVSMLALVLLTAACAREEGAPRQPDEAAVDLPEKADAAAPGYAAEVQLAPTEGHTARGSLILSGAPEGVQISGVLQELSPDREFAFHIHEHGDCSAPDASSAGGHFNPAAAEHGHPEGESHHAGDMVNVRSDAEGMAQVDTAAPGVTVGTGESNDVLGRAIVVHASPDDYSSQPSGNAGARIACGVIVQPG